MVNPSGDSEFPKNEHARIRIVSSNSTPYSFDSFWLLLDFKDCVNIRQVKKKALEYVEKLQKLESESITEGLKVKSSLWLSESRIPSFERSHILRDGDTVHLHISHIPCEKDTKVSLQKHENTSNSHSKSKIKKCLETKKTRKRQFLSDFEDLDLDAKYKSKKKKYSKSPTKCNLSSNHNSSEKNCPDMDNNRDCDEGNKNYTQPQENTELKDIDHDVKVTDCQNSLVTPEIQELLQGKLAQIQNKDILIEINGDSKADGDVLTTNPPKRKRNRRKNKKIKPSNEGSIQKPKPPPNYSLNLPTNNSRVVFEESDEEATDILKDTTSSVATTSNTKLSPLKENENLKKVIPPSCYNKNTNFSAHAIKQVLPPQSSDFPKPHFNNKNLNKQSPKLLGISIDPNAKFSELINRTRRRPQQLSDISTLGKSSQIDVFEKQNLNELKLSFSSENKERHQSSSDPISRPCTTFNSVKEITSQPSTDVTNGTTSIGSSQATCKENGMPKIYTSEDVARASILSGKPCDEDIIAFKMMELSEDYTPSISDFKIGRVLSYNSQSDDISVELQEVGKKRSGRFELDYGDEDETVDSKILTSFTMLLEVRLLSR